MMNTPSEIITLTLNPAFDVHVGIEHFLAEHENIADTTVRDIGGKGINISRALCENGISNTPIIVLGSENAGDFKRGLIDEGLDCKIIECDGRIRENITVHPKNGNETRLSFKGFTCPPRLLDQIEALIGDGSTVTFTGSVPDGISAAETEAFLMRIKQKASRLVVDSKSVTLDMLRRIKPWLIKPNSEEISAYFKEDLTDDGIYNAALSLNRDGIENVIISLGDEGAVLACDGILYRARVPKIDVLSTIGAGDSTIAGFIATDGDPADKLRTAVSYGSAACLREGTKPPLAGDIEGISRLVSTERLIF